MARRSKTTVLWMALKRFLKPPFRSYLLENKYRVVPAFELKGKRYFMFSDQMEVPTGRQLAALAIYNEMDMRADRAYLELHCKAVDKVLSDPKKVSIGVLYTLNTNLRERLDLMVLPSFIYKLASVVFFDESESPYTYDFEYNEAKIAEWKQSGATMDFFLRTPLKDLIPSLKAQEGVFDIYSTIAEMVGQTHRELITGILSEEA